ncbi:P-type conjugative transfer protein TrbG [Phenylobacterium sp.]|uniref:P-type conjugative transfer protein TrbG n=1 Tax=Phenylobacterium sp. TaxID=1871053 RepID=UPI0035AEA37D
MRLPCLAALAAAAATPGLAGPLPPAVHAWSPGTLYAVTAAPGRVTDIALEPGESLAGQGPVAAGDTARWIIGQAESGAGAQRQAHVLVKPVQAGLATNLIIHTDRRSYLLELRSTEAAWTPQVAWRYPAGELTALARPATAGPSSAAPAAPPAVDPAALNFNWRIEGRAPFRPVRVFDDGRRTYVDFPDTVRRGELPPLFAAGPDGALEGVSGRLAGSRLIVDRVFARGELRLGAGRRAARVALVREVAP